MNCVNQVRPQFVDFIPEAPRSGRDLYLKRYSTASHLCCCGCGLRSRYAIDPRAGPDREGRHCFVASVGWELGVFPASRTTGSMAIACAGLRLWHPHVIAAVKGTRSARRRDLRRKPLGSSYRWHARSSINSVPLVRRWASQPIIFSDVPSRDRAQLIPPCLLPTDWLFVMNFGPASGELVTPGWTSDGTTRPVSLLSSIWIERRLGHRH